MQIFEISSYEANDNAKVDNNTFSFILSVVCAITLTAGMFVIMPLMVINSSELSWWILGMFLSASGAAVTGCWLLFAPVGYWTCMSLLHRFNRILAKASTMQQMKKLKMAAWSYDEIDFALAPLAEIRNDILKAFKLSGDFRKHRKIARRGRISRKPWNLASFVAHADIARIRSRMDAVDREITKMMASARAPNT